MYSELEEKWNVRSHGLGLVLGISGAPWLLWHSENLMELSSSLIFSISLSILYLASTLYHAATAESKRRKLRIFDHAAIFILIAGTYTPVCLLKLEDPTKSTLLITVWTIAAVGILLKVFFTGRFRLLSTFLYVGMGWVALFAIDPIKQSLDGPSISWLLAGGLFYSVGAILYSIKKIPFNHALFHVFVLGGSICHYFMVFAMIK